jgi:HEAT repeat protein
MRPRSPALSYSRLAAAGALALLVAVAVNAQPPAEAPKCAAPQDKKDEPKKEEYKWPTEIAGKTVAVTLKDIEDPDPVIREFAARNLPGYGPAVSGPNASGLILKRMRVEADPGVKAAVYAAAGGIQFKDENHNTEALRLLVTAIDGAADGSSLRLAAVQAVMQWGTKGSGAIAALTGRAAADPSYGTRQHIAMALGRVGFDEVSGPNTKALTVLADTFAKDPSAAVRMQAMSSLLELGPSWVEKKAPGAKTNPQSDPKVVATIVRLMRARVGDPKAKPPVPALEKDKQVEICARLVLMRFDPKELQVEENLDAVANYLTGTDDGAKLQALQALAILGEGASKKISSVVRVLEDKETPFQVTVAAITTLGTFGAASKTVLPNMKAHLELKKKEMGEKKLELAKKKEKDDLKLVGEVASLEAIVRLLEEAIKHIECAKPTSPAELKNEPAKKP